MLDFQAWIERNFGKWTWRELGIALGIVVALIGTFDVTRAVKGHFWPKAAAMAKGAGDTGVLKRWRDRDDARGFHPLPAALTQAGDDSFDIAWISASPTAIQKAIAGRRLDGQSHYNMADVASRYLLSLDGRPTRIHMFHQSGMHAGDVRRAVLYTAHQPEIDFYVMELNALRIMLDYSLFSPAARQRSNLLRMPGATWFDYSVAARLLRPSEIGLELTSAMVPLVRDRYDFFGSLAYPKATAFPTWKPPKHAPRGNALAEWQKWFHPQVLSLPTVARAKEQRASRNGMLMSNVTRRRVGRTILIENLRTLARTGKPVLLYFAPLNANLANDAVTLEFMRRMIATVEAAMAEVSAANITLDTQMLWSEPDAAKFADVIHLKDGQRVIDSVAASMEQRLGKPFVRRPLDEVYDPAPKPKPKPAADRKL